MLLMRDQFLIYFFSNLLERKKFFYKEQDKNSYYVLIKNTCNTFNLKNITH